MKIYISLPITGQGIEAVEASVIFAKAVIKKKGHEPVSPLDQDTTQDYATLMGNDIRELLQCDAVLFLDGWKESKGCRLENTAATIYGKERFYSLDKIPETTVLWHQLGKEEDDLSQVWHDAKEEVDWHDAAPGVFVQYVNGAFAVFFSVFPTMDERHPKIARWAYIKDLLPHG